MSKSDRSVSFSESQVGASRVALTGRSTLPRETVTSVLLGERLAITAYLTTITRNYHLAEDVYQDICVRAVCGDNHFETEEHLLNWVRATGRNRAIDVIRVRDGRYQGLSIQLLEKLSVEWSSHAHVDQEVRELLRDCMQTLTENNRRLLRLRYGEDRSGGEIAACLGRKVQSIYQALSRIHKSLAECVQNRIDLREGAP